MGILNWLKSRKSGFKRFDDAFALNRLALWQSLRSAVQSADHTDKSIWLVVHFTDTFGTLQDQLDLWQMDYMIVTQPVEANQLDNSGLLNTSQIKLILAELIPEAEIENVIESDTNQTIAMIVVERHPDFAHDVRLEQFARSLSVNVEFGYFLALDDETIRLVVNDTSIEILKQLGMNEHELITSNMVTRRLNATLPRIAKSFNANKPADSAREWLEINASKDSSKRTE